MSYFQQHHVPYHHQHHQQPQQQHAAQPPIPGFQHQQQQQQHMMMQGGFPQYGQQQQQQQQQGQQHHQQDQQHQYRQQYGNHHQNHHQNHQNNGNNNHQHHQHHHHSNNNDQYYPPPPMMSHTSSGTNNNMMMMMMETEEDRLEAQAANDLLDADSKHEFMLPIGYAPCPNTVIVGRGKKVAQHAGNVRFRELVKRELAEYSAATTKAHKSSIIVRVLSDIRQRSPLGFVKQNLTTLRWYRVEETAQRITTAQAFRDALKDDYKSSRAYKKHKREEEKKTGNDKPSRSTSNDSTSNSNSNNKKRSDGTDADDTNDLLDEADDSPSASPVTSRSSSPKATAPKSFTPLSQETKKEAPQQQREDPGQEDSKMPSTGPPPPSPPQVDKPRESATAAATAVVPPAAEAPKKPNPAALEKMRAMLEAQQSEFTAGNFTWWKPEVVKPTNKPAPTSSTSRSDRKMPPPSSRRNHHNYDRDHNNDTNMMDPIPSTSMASDWSLLWSSHSKYSDRAGAATTPSSAAAGRPPRNKERDGSFFNFSNHSTMSTLNKWSNHSIMSISGHSARSNSTFNGLMAKYMPTTGGDTDRTNPFEPRPIAVAVQEHKNEQEDDDAAMESMIMDMDRLPNVLTSTAEMEASANSYSGRTQPYAAKSTTTFDEGMAMGLGNLSDHSLMSNMSSIHSVRFTAEEIFADTSASNHNNPQGKDRRACHPGSLYRGGYNYAMSM